MTISFDEFQEAHANYSSVGAHNEETWRPVINVLEKEGWGPYEYLDYVFREFKKPLVPTLLLSGKVIDMYREERKARAAANERKAQRTMEQIHNRLRNNTPVEDILTDPELVDNALLMYLVARVAKKEKEAESFKEAALYELRTMPELVDIYSVKFDRRLMPC